MQAAGLCMRINEVQDKTDYKSLLPLFVALDKSVNLSEPLSLHFNKKDNAYCSSLQKVLNKMIYRMHLAQSRLWMNVSHVYLSLVFTRG